MIAAVNDQPQQNNLPEGSAKDRVVTDRDADQITRAEELAYELKIEEVMSRDLKFVAPDIKMSEVLELFRQWQISGAPVAVDKKLVGIISMEDLIRCLKIPALDATVNDFMTSKGLITTSSTDTVIEALKLFVSTKVGRLPVINEKNELVGILTKGDITRGLLKALEVDYQQEEVRRYRASHLFEDIESDRTSLILRYNIKPRDFTHGGAASGHIKRALVRMGATPQVARRCGIAVYEAEMNLIIHTNNGGIIRVEIEPHQISVEVIDDGPGIPDVDLAMKPGYSTATEEVRELGFGAGMGLVNIARCVDQMKLESSLEKGTRLRMKFLLEAEEPVGKG